MKLFARCVLTAALTIPLPVAAQEQAAPAAPATFPMWEDYLSRGEGSINQYVRDAMAYIDGQDGEHEPRVLMDLHMLGTSLNSADLVNQTRFILLFAYPETPPSAYLVKSFADDKAFREFLLQALRVQLAQQPDLPGAFVRAVRLGVKFRGQDVMNDARFALVTLLCAEAGGDAELAEQVRAALLGAQVQQPWEQTLLAAAVSGDAPAAKINRVAAHLDRGLVALAVELWSRQLPAEALADEALLETVAEAVLRRGSFAKALPLVERLRGVKDTPRRAVWQAWALAATGERDEAVAVLNALPQAEGEEAWRAMAEAYAAALQAPPDVARSYAERLHAAATQIGDRSGAMEMQMRIEGDANRPALSLYLAMDAAGFLELRLRENERMLAAIRGTAKQVSLYDAQRNVTRRFDGPLLPFLTASIEESIGGSYTFGVNFGLTSNPEEMYAGLRRFANTPALASVPACERVMAYLQRSGWLAAPIQQRDGERVLTLVAPRVREPSLRTIAMTLSADDRLVAIRGQGFEADPIRLGSQDEVRFNPPEWPKAQAVPGQERPAQAVMEIVATVTRLISERVGEAE